MLKLKKSNITAVDTQYMVYLDQIECNKFSSEQDAVAFFNEIKDCIKEGRKFTYEKNRFFYSAVPKSTEIMEAL